MILSPGATAQALLLAAKRYGETRGREITRFQFKAQTLRKISGRVHIRQVMVDALSDAFGEHGWILTQLTDSFCAVKESTIDGWPRVTSKLLREELREVRNGAAPDATFALDDEEGAEEYEEDE